MVGRLEKIGIAVLTGFVGLAVISFVLPRIDPMYIPLYGTDPDIIGYSQPSSQHILGTDFLGRDLFSQLCSGAYFALINGIILSIIGVPVMVVAAFIMAQLRKETPQLEDTAVIRFTRFVAFPLSVIGFFTILTLLLGSVLGRMSWINVLFLAAPLAGLIGWLAVGHEIETRVRRGEKLPTQLLFSGAAIIISYTTIYNAVFGFFGLGDPTAVDWGMMIQWCFTSGYTFKAMNWLLSPIICIYVFSRGMLALSYGLFNASSKKYFFKEGWF